MALLELQMLEAPEREGGEDAIASILDPNSDVSLLLCH
ncbi:SapB/AmfS family lanthipeptide [Streptomyces purpurogeneiscleroticus]|nr:SapB/AmfS family lanthipeptide [Streptomyces purpurogeneiscleroticus]